ncbi:MAG: NTF2 fold immunity protein [Bacillota bacterium]
MNKDIHQEEIDMALQVVLEFVERMNAWETKMYYHSRIKNNMFVKAEHENKFKGLNDDDLINEYYSIIEDMCTKKKRVYGGHPTKYGKPPTYSGISIDAIIDSLFVKEDRIEIDTKGGCFPDQEYKFVLFKRKGKWLIDNLKTRVGNKNEFRQTLI